MSGLWIADVARAPISGPKVWMLPLMGRSHQLPVTKLLWHTTEGSTIEGAEAAYKSRAGTLNGVHPHLTIDPSRRRIVQHISFDKSSYSVMDRSDRRGVIQVEVVGRAALVSSWPNSWWQWLGTDVARPIVDACPLIDLTIWPQFHGAGEGIILASKTSPIRMSDQQFDRFIGQLGHQHAPSPDSHWDPGLWRPDLIASAALNRTIEQTGTVMDLSMGSKGPAVKQLQQMLDMFPKAGLAVDGVFGPATKAAVIAYQTALHVTPADGIWGPDSVAAQAQFVRYLEGLTPVETAPVSTVETIRPPLASVPDPVVVDRAPALVRDIEAVLARYR